MKKYTLYIGSNNKTKILNIPYAVNIVAVRYRNFSYYPIKGYYNGELEDTLAVVICTTDAKDIIIKLCSELKQLLKQQAIMLIESNDIITFE